MEIQIKLNRNIEECNLLLEKIKINNSKVISNIKEYNKIEYNTLSCSEENRIDSIVLIDFISINLNFEFLQEIQENQNLNWFHLLKVKIEDVVIQCENEFIQKKINFFEGLCYDEVEFKNFHDIRWVHNVILISDDNQFFDIFFNKIGN